MLCRRAQLAWTLEPKAPSAPQASPHQPIASSVSSARLVDHKSHTAGAQDGRQARRWSRPWFNMVCNGAWAFDVLQASATGPGQPMSSPSACGISFLSMTMCRCVPAGTSGSLPARPHLLGCTGSSDSRLPIMVGAPTSGCCLHITISGSPEYDLHLRSKLQAQPKVRCRMVAVFRSRPRKPFRSADCDRSSWLLRASSSAHCPFASK